MFLTNDVLALFKKGVLKLVTNDEGETRRVAEATCVIEPFPIVLARELGEEVAGHLFDDEDRIRQEIESIDLRIRVGLQQITVKPDPELDAMAILNDVSVKDISASVIEDEKKGRCWIAFTFVLVFSLETREARNFVLDQFGRELYWTFERIQPDMLPTPERKARATAGASAH